LLPLTDDHACRLADGFFAGEGPVVPLVIDRHLVGVVVWCLGVRRSRWRGYKLVLTSVLRIGFTFRVDFDAPFASVHYGNFKLDFDFRSLVPPLANLFPGCVTQIVKVV